MPPRSKEHGSTNVTTLYSYHLFCGRKDASGNDLDELVADKAHDKGVIKFKNGAAYEGETLADGAGYALTRVAG